MKFCSACMNMMDIEAANNVPLYVCSVCGAKEKLADGTVIYENKKVRNLENISAFTLANTPTLPRTKDYICPNKDCESHADPLRKEAIFRRTSDSSFETEYMCVLCYTRFIA